MCFNVVGIYYLPTENCDLLWAGCAHAASPPRTHQPQHYMHSQALTGPSNAACSPISWRHMVLVSTCSFGIRVCHKAARWDVFIWVVKSCFYILKQFTCSVCLFYMWAGKFDGFVSIFTRNISINQEIFMLCWYIYTDGNCFYCNILGLLVSSHPVTCSHCVINRSEYILCLTYGSCLISKWRFLPVELIRWNHQIFFSLVLKPKVVWTWGFYSNLNTGCCHDVNLNM